MKKIHFVGIKGVGMTPLAVIAKEAKMYVTGSDTKEIYITDEVLQKAGITVFEGFSKEHVQGVDLVVTTGAHGGLSNPEVIAAKEQGIEVLLQGQAVGEFMKGDIFRKEFLGISVAGCHGKTTTTAMIATLLKEGGKDPSWVIGTGNIPSLGNSGHFGKGEYFVAEADEYATEPHLDKTPKFLWQHPKLLVITNIEFDHPDLYNSLVEVRLAYEAFAKQLDKDEGILIANGDDAQTKILLDSYEGEVITFGEGKENDYILSVKKNNTFSLRVPQENWQGEFSLEVAGKHNVYNATAAIIVSRELGLSEKQIQQGLLLFSGTKRRLEYRGTLSSGAIIYDDYAHHPTEIKASLLALKEKYPDKHIICVFQPHTYSRTKLLFNEFVDSLSFADEIFMVEIYPSAREEKDTTISSSMIADGLKKREKTVLFLEKPNDMVKYINHHMQDFDEKTVLVTMGAGDVYQIADTLLSK
ncbi:MAG TPA: UDP-N-acetylmuramate--L-alanine ligase [Patescibacteria group bacterium]|nr:UDP-N-acetylmuramate--L-alanine ligase [Patescibacteria group bacterium]